MTPLERFSAKYIPEPNSGCFLWLAACNSGGYGHFGVDGKIVDAHRFSYETYVGPIPPNTYVLHRCDQVESIRRDTRTHRKIASAYGIGKTSVGNIKLGVTWKVNGKS